MAIGWTQLLQGIGGRLKGPGKAAPVADADAFATVLADIEAKAAAVPVTSHAKGGSVTVQAARPSSEKPKPGEPDASPEPTEPGAVAQAAVASLVVPVPPTAAPTLAPTSVDAHETSNAPTNASATTSAVFASGSSANPITSPAPPTATPWPWNSHPTPIGAKEPGNPTSNGPAATGAPFVSPPDEKVVVAPPQAVAPSKPDQAHPLGSEAVQESIASSAGEAVRQDASAGAPPLSLTPVPQSAQPTANGENQLAATPNQQSDRTRGIISRLMERVEVRFNPSLRAQRTYAPAPLPTSGAQAGQSTVTPVAGSTAAPTHEPVAPPDPAPVVPIQTAAGPVAAPPAAPSVPMSGASNVRAQAAPSNSVAASPAFAAPIPISQPSPRWRNTEGNGHTTAPAGTAPIEGQRPGPIPTAGRAPVATPVEPDPTETPIAVEPAPIPVTVSGTQSGPPTQSAPPPMAPVAVEPAPIPITVSGTQSGPPTQSAPPPKAPVAVEPAPIPITVTGTQSGPPTQSAPLPSTPVEIGDPSPRWRNTEGSARQAPPVGASTPSPRQAPVQTTIHTEPLQPLIVEAMEQPVANPGAQTVTSAPVDNTPKPLTAYGPQSGPVPITQTAPNPPVELNNSQFRSASADETDFPAAAAAPIPSVRAEGDSARTIGTTIPPQTPATAQPRVTESSVPLSEPQAQASSLRGSAPSMAAPEASPAQANNAPPAPAFAAPIPISRPSPRWRNTEGTGHTTAPAGTAPIEGQRPGPIPTAGRAPVATPVEPDPTETPIRIEPAPIPITVTGTQSGPPTQSAPPPKTPIGVEPGLTPITVTGMQSGPPTQSAPPPKTPIGVEPGLTPITVSGTQSGPPTQSAPPPSTPVEIGDPSPRWRNTEGSARQAPPVGATTPSPRQSPVQTTIHTERLQPMSVEAKEQPVANPGAQAVTSAPVDNTPKPVSAPDPQAASIPPRVSPVQTAGGSAPMPAAVAAPLEPAAQPTPVPPMTAAEGLHTFAEPEIVNTISSTEHSARESAIRNGIDPGVPNQTVVVNTEPAIQPMPARSPAAAESVQHDSTDTPFAASESALTAPQPAIPLSVGTEAAQIQVPHIQSVEAMPRSTAPIGVAPGEPEVSVPTIPAPAPMTPEADQPVQIETVGGRPTREPAPAIPESDFEPPAGAPQRIQSTVAEPIDRAPSLRVSQGIAANPAPAETSRPVQANAAARATAAEPLAGEAAVTVASEGNQTLAGAQIAAETPRLADNAPAIPTLVGGGGETRNPVADASNTAPASAQQPDRLVDGPAVASQTQSAAAPVESVSNPSSSTAATLAPLTSEGQTPHAEMGSATLEGPTTAGQSAQFATPSVPVAAVEPSAVPPAIAPAPRETPVATPAPELIEAVLPSVEAAVSQPLDAPERADEIAPTLSQANAMPAFAPAPTAPIAAPDMPASSPVNASVSAAPIPVPSTPALASQSVVATTAEPTIAQGVVSDADTARRFKEPGKQVTSAQAAKSEAGKPIQTAEVTKDTPPPPAQGTIAPIAVPGQKAAEQAVQKDVEKPANTLPVPPVSTGARSGAADSIVQGLQAARTVAANPTGTAAPVIAVTSASELSPRRVVDQVVREIRVEVGHGRSEMTIRLDPPELGQVAVKLVSQNGTVTAGFHAETEGVRSTLEAHIPALRTALAEAGITVNSFTVSTGSNFGASQQRSTDQQPTSRRRESSRRATPAAAQAVEAGRGRRITTSVDYFA